MSAAPRLTPDPSASDLEARIDARFLALEERVRVLEAARLRDLEERIAAYEARARDREARAEAIEPAKGAPAVGIAPPISPRAQTLAEHDAKERARIESALKETRWNKVKAAEMLGMPRRTFYRRLKEYGMG